MTMTNRTAQLHRQPRPFPGFSPSALASPRKTSPFRGLKSCCLKPVTTLTIAALSCTIGFVRAQEKKPAAAAINGVKGVQQEAVQSIRKVEPPTVNPPPPSNPAQTVNKIDGVKAPGQDAPPSALVTHAVQSVNAIQGIKVPGTGTPPPPPPAGNAAHGVNKVEGIQAATPNAVQGLPPSPAAAVSSIRAVQGVQGIIAPKQLNLEAALLMKEASKGPPVGGGAEGGKGKAAAAALLSGPPIPDPAPPTPAGDGRAELQEKPTSSGS